MSRPKRVVVVAGTGTEVGKTFMTAAIALELMSQRRTVAARKPAQSFSPDDTSTDAAILGAATSEDAETICPPHRWYPLAMAPPMAAAALGRDPFTIADLAAEVTKSWPAGDTAIDLAFVESAGGAWSPQASDGLHVGDFADALEADGVLLVADAGLGVISAVRGSMVAFGNARKVIVLLNRYDENNKVHTANRNWLTHEDHLTVVVDPAEAAVALSAL